MFLPWIVFIDVHVVLVVAVTENMLPVAAKLLFENDSTDERSMGGQRKRLARTRLHIQRPLEGFVL